MQRESGCANELVKRSALPLSVSATTVGDTILIRLTLRIGLTHGGIF
jgi:hypothetical protein